MQAIESLQVSIPDSGDYVKCQKHDMAIPILRTMIKPKSNRIAILEKQIKWIEEHYQYRHRHDNTSNNNDDGVYIKQLKQELAELLAEDAKVDKLRSLPLYSCRITDFKFVCSKCYERLYNNNMLIQRR